jgi:hypothetical protein
MPTDLMRQRKTAIDWAAASATPVLCRLRDDRCRVPVAELRVTVGLVSRLAGLLDRYRGEGGPGIALVCSPPGPLAATRQFSMEIMTALRVSGLLEMGKQAGPGTRMAETVTADGAIPLELFGSAWTFKPPHMDRESLYFSHVYGPTRGFSGGEVILIDALAFAAARSLRFDQAFDWSDEPEVQKPVLRREHIASAVAEFGVNLGRLPDHDILIVNNTPDGGILHGAIELRDIGSGFAREIHRVAIRPGPPAGRQ